MVVILVFGAALHVLVNTHAMCLPGMELFSITHGYNSASMSFVKPYCLKQTHGINDRYLEQMNMRAESAKHIEEMLLEDIHPMTYECN